MSNVSKCVFCANKKDYDAKFGYFGCNYSGQECKDYSMFEPKVKPKPITNADCIRGMTDEELAEWLWLKVGKCPPFDVCPSQRIPCEAKDCWLDWLKQEAEE